MTVIQRQLFIPMARAQQQVPLIVKRNNMEPIVIILLIALGLLIQFGLIYAAIRLATERERKLLKIQTALLSKIAIKQGVHKLEVDDLYIIEKLKILL